MSKLRQAAERLNELMCQYHEAPYVGYDPPPWAFEIQERKMYEQVENEFGFCREDVENELYMMYEEESIQSQADDGPYGRIV